MRNHLFVALVILLIEVVIVGVFTPNDWLTRSIREERTMVTRWLGGKTTQALIQQTNTIYKTLFVDTGIVHASYGYIPTREDRQNSPGLEHLGERYYFPYFKDRIDVMWSAIYQSIQRLTLFMLWTPYMLPLFIPAMYDGLSIRNIKKVTYGYASPVRYQTAFLTIVFLLAAIPFYLAIPVAVTPMIVPLWTIVFSLAVMLMTSNLQKKI